MTDIIIMIILVGLVITYIVVVSRRKKREMEIASGKVEDSDENTELELLKKQHFMETLKEQNDKQIETHLVDYSVYHLSIKEYIFYAVMASTLFFFVGYLFYESIIASIVSAALGLFYPK